MTTEPRPGTAAPGGTASQARVPVAEQLLADVISPYHDVDRQVGLHPRRGHASSRAARSG
ncbi:hypothetical protein [Micromonospora sp. NPDC003776]